MSVVSFPPGRGGTLGDGETYANAAVDVRGPHAGMRLNADGADWAIRNVAIVGGVKGSPGNPDGGLPVIEAAVDEGATGLIENLWLVDPPQHHDSGRWAGGIRVQEHHAGELVIRGVNIQHHTAFGIDTAPPGRETPEAGGGTVRIEHAHLANNAPANITTGAPTTITDTVSYTDAGAVRSPVDDAGRSRGIVCRANTTHIHESHVTMHADDYAVEAADGGAITLTDTPTRGATRGPLTVDGGAGDPKVYLPAGCPDSAYDAVTRPLTDEGTDTEVTQ